jgi:hypothetical protein
MRMSWQPKDTAKLLKSFSAGWELKRWQYDGARYELHNTGLAVVIEIEGAMVTVEMEIASDMYGGGYSTRSFSIPLAILQELLKLDSKAPAEEQD